MNKVLRLGAVVLGCAVLATGCSTGSDAVDVNNARESGQSEASAPPARAERHAAPRRRSTRKAAGIPTSNAAVSRRS